MSIQELIERLQEFDQSMAIMILDGFNGGGNPREINLGPRLETITQKDADNTCDCEDKVGQEVVILGYGFY